MSEDVTFTIDSNMNWKKGDIITIKSESIHGDYRVLKITAHPKDELLKFTLELEMVKK